MSLSSTTTHDRHITAFFDTRAGAEKAVNELITAGLPGARTSVTGDQDVGTTEAATGDRSFWDSLKDLFLPDEDRYAYAEGLRRGGFLVSVYTDDSGHDRALDILSKEGSVDMDEREKEWRSQGWDGFGNTAVGSDLVGAGTLGLSASGIAMAPPVESPVTDRPRILTRRDTTADRGAVRSYVVESADDLRHEDGSHVPKFNPATDAARIVEHMDVIASDRQKIGTVDHLDGPDTIKLAKTTSPDGQHHLVSLAWVDHVDTHVHLNRTTAQVMSSW